MTKKELLELIAEIHSDIDMAASDAKGLTRSIQDIYTKMEDIPEDLDGIQDIPEVDDGKNKEA